MAIESIKLETGMTMPAFNLPDPHGKIYTHNEVSGKKGTLIIFTCNHCPYALAVWPRIIEIASSFKPDGVETVAINPNIHPGYPADAPDKMAEKIREWNLPFPYLVDESQNTARAYQAQCTPDIYLFDGGQKLVYHGRIDDNWKEPEKVTRNELSNAIKNMLDGKPPFVEQYPTLGCSIKWRE